jgi:hypothetical protein
LTGIVWRLAALFAAVALSSAPPLRAEAPAATISPALPFTLVRGKILFAAQVDGHPVTALLDSGADFSVLDAGLVRAWGIAEGAAGAIASPGGKVSTQIVGPVQLKIADQVNVKLRMLSIDLKGASALVGQRIDMIVGGDLLRARAVKIGFAAGRLRFVPSGDAPYGFTPVPLTRARYAPLATIDVDGKPLTVLVDLGANADLSVSPEAWARIRPAGAITTDSAAGAVGGKLAVVGKGHLPRLRFGPYVERDVDVRIAPVSAHLTGKAEGSIGMAMLGRYELTLDIAANKL